MHPIALECNTKTASGCCSHLPPRLFKVDMSTNPFDDDDDDEPVVVASANTPQSLAATVNSNSSTRRHPSRSSLTPRVRSKEPAIWAARNVEWPLPTTISLSHYQKLLQKQGQEADSFSGWMRSVLPGTSISASASTADTGTGGSRPLKTPRCVATANGWIVAALECAGSAAGPRLVSRWNVRRPTTNDHNILCVPPPKGTDSSRIMHIFCDPTGCHTVLSAKNGELYYLHSSSKTIIALPGFGPNATLTGNTASSAASSKDATLQTGVSPGSYVTAIAWDRQRGTEGSTKTILLGTSAGEVYECSLSNDPAEVELPLLLHRVVAAPITGFYFERSATGLAILVATAGSHSTRLYSFFSHDTSFRTAFASPQLLELPGSIPNTELHVNNDSSFGLLTASGMYYGTLQGDKIVQAGMLSYDKVPISMALTPHHVIFLYDTQVVFYNRVSQRIIQKERVDWSSSEDSSQLLMDIRRPDQVWLRKARTLVHISSTMEDRDVWKFTLQKCLEDGPKSQFGDDVLAQKEALFEHAKALCTNTVQKAIVTYVRAEYHLSHKRPVLASKFLAKCPPQLAPFPDTALRLENEALIAYLSDKLRACKVSEDSVLSTMLGAWLTELHLHEREHNRSYIDSNLQAFLSSNSAQLDAKTVLRILSSHDVSAGECADYAAASGDIGTAVQTALGKDGDAYDALRILNDAALHVAEPYYYRYASILLARSPLAASKSFLSRYSQGLNPAKLLPSLMDYERKRVEFRRAKELRGPIIEGPAIATTEITEDDDDLQHLRVDSVKSFTDSGAIINSGVEVRIKQQASFVDEDSATIQYLEGVIKLGCRNSAVYSYLISLYVAMEDEEPLIRFLRTHVPAAATAAEVTKKALLSSNSGNLHRFDDGLSATPLDMSYALRTILSTGRHFRSAIRLYMGFGLRQQAVELALKVDPTLARDLAHEATDHGERKRLWLMIARNATGDRAGGKDVVAKVVAVLKDCGPDVLSIEDVLPFL